MQVISRSIFAAILFSMIAAAAPLHAATVNDFYLSLLKRGIEHINAGNNDLGASELKLAAFGLVDSVQLYQTAQVYLAVASQRLNREPQTRAAAIRVFTAERIEQHYATLTLPETIRKEFETLAPKMLTAAQWETLRNSKGEPASSTTKL